VTTENTTRLKSLWLPGGALALIVLFGAAVRAYGFSHSDPWFDDAWVVLSTKVPLSSAVHMVDTTPLFTLGMRAWIGFHPHSLWWDQLPVFLCGLLAIVAVFFLLRYFKLWWPLAFLGALVIAASPVAITYSTRVKQYNLDILLACALWWLFERWRRDPSRRAAIILAATASLALLISATTIVVIAPIGAVALLYAWRQRERRVEVAIILAAAGATLITEYLIWLRGLSHGLHVGWTNRGYLLTFSSVHKFLFSLQTMSTQFFHWMIGVPTGHPPDPSKAITFAGVVIAIVVVTLLVAVTIGPLWTLTRRRQVEPTQFAAPALSLAFAVALALMTVSPFGGGRTDEVIYPGVLLLFGTAVSQLQQRWSQWTRFFLVAAVLAGASCAVVGERNRANYPTINLRGLYATFHPHVKQTDYIVVDPWLTFTWSDDSLSRTGVSFKKTFFDWSQGFHVVSYERQVVISDEYFFPNWVYGLIHNSSSRLWYVGETVQSRGNLLAPVDALLPTRNLHFLRTHDWVPTRVDYRSTHTMALLMKYVPGSSKAAGLTH
jgi:hypothetical protein